MPLIMMMVMVMVVIRPVIALYLSVLLECVDVALYLLYPALSMGISLSTSPRRRFSASRSPSR